MALQFCLLGSGSSGNAVLVTTEKSKILIDSGLSFRQMQLRASLVGETLDGVDAVFVTHEHGDHVQGLGTLCRKLGVMVYMTPGTRDSLPKTVGELPRVELAEAGSHIGVGDMAVTSFSVSHDASDPVSYVIEHAGLKLGFASDLGHPTLLVRNRLAGSHALVLESNYCPDRLRRGKYPPMLQQRIRGRQGHLSNGDMGGLLSELLHERLRLVVLVHVSEENNDHQLAYQTAGRVLQGRNVELHVAMQDKPTPLFTVA